MPYTAMRSTPPMYGCMVMLISGEETYMKAILMREFAPPRSSGGERSLHLVRSQEKSSFRCTPSLSIARWTDRYDRMEATMV
jgi:hypothetical protein